MSALDLGLLAVLVTIVLLGLGFVGCLLVAILAAGADPYSRPDEDT